MWWEATWIRWPSFTASSVPLSGVITAFEAPGAGTSPSGGTYATAVNLADAITGFYLDASGAFRGYVRDASGAFTVFDAPGAGTGAGEGTQPTGINNAGDITGTVIVSSAPIVETSFVRTASGAITAFHAPGGAADTVANGINARGISPDGSPEHRAAASTDSCGFHKRPPDHISNLPFHRISGTLNSAS